MAVASDKHKPPVVDQPKAFIKYANNVPEMLRLGLNVLLSVGVYLFVRAYLFEFGRIDQLAQVILLGSLTLVLSQLKNQAFSPGSLILLRGLALMWGTFVIWRGVGLGFNSAPALSWEFFGLVIAPGLTVLAAIATWFRPGFALVAFITSLWQFSQFQTSTHLPILTTIDFFVTIEAPVFLLTFIALTTGLQRHWPMSETSIQSFRSFALLLALTVHVGNYFFAGWGKVVLEDPWTWLLENPTADLMLGAAAQGVSPIGLFPAFYQTTYDFLSSTNVLTNSWVLGIQLFGLIAFWRRRWLIFSLLMYDMLHIGIYVLTGIMFWKWVVLNTLAIWALRKDGPYQWSVGHRGLLTVLVLASSAIFNMPWLAWFDSRGVNVFSVMAEGTDATGKPFSVRVPSNFFGPHSFNLATNWHYRPQGLLPSTQYGVTFTYDHYLSSSACELTPTSDQPFNLGANIVGFVKEHHRRAVSAWERSSTWSFDTHPHHVWSYASYFRDFYQIDPRTISAYVLKVDAKCLRAVDGHVTGPVLATHQTRIKLNQ